MSTVAEQRDTFLSEAVRFATARAGKSAPWLRELRQAAADRFAAVGVPTVRQEAWRFTNVSPLAEISFRLGEGQPTNAAELVARVAVPAPALRVVTLNGAFARHLSNLPQLPSGVRVMSLADAFRDGLADAEELAASALDKEPFVALNTAFLDDGVYVSVEPGVELETPLHMIVVAGGPARAMVHPRTVIRLGAGSRASLAHSCIGAAGGAHLTNSVTQIALAPGARLDLCVDQRETESATHVATIHARCSRESSLFARTVTLGGRLLRNDVTAVLEGEGAHCTLEGVYLADGERLVDNHTTIDHAAPHCTSHELYKGILDGKARAVFNGRIIVRPDAQKTDAKQTNRALLLSDDAQINSNPQLEIFADDVKCTHGAAVGQLDEDAMFYLQARGLPPRAARDLLIHAYAGDVLRGIAIEPLRLQLERDLFVALDRDLAGHQAAS